MGMIKMCWVQVKLLLHSFLFAPMGVQKGVQISSTLLYTVGKGAVQYP